MGITGRDIEKVITAVRLRLGSLGSGGAPTVIKTIAPHTHSSDQVTHEFSGLIAADDVQEALEELDIEKLARDGTQTMLGTLQMNTNDITGILNATANGGIGDAVFSGIRKILMAGVDSDGEASIANVERITFNNKVGASLIDLLSLTRWNAAVIPGTDFTPAEGDMSWNNANGLNRPTTHVSSPSGLVETPLAGGIYIRVRDGGGGLAAGQPCAMTLNLDASNVLLADPTTEVTRPFILRGVTMHAIAAFAQGWVCLYGYLGGIDLSAFSANNQVHLSSANPGLLTASPPTKGQGFGTTMGMVIDGSNPGSMFVNITGTETLDSLANVGTDGTGKTFFDVPTWMDRSPHDLWTPKPASFYPTITKTGTNYAILDGDVYIDVDVGGADRVITLPLVAASLGKTVYIKKIDSGREHVIIDGNGAETIDGEATFDLVLEHESVTVICDGSEWRIL